MEDIGSKDGNDSPKNLYQKILTLRRKGLFYVDIATCLGVTDRTVRNSLRKKGKARAKKLDSFEGEIRKILSTDPQKSARSIFRLLQEKGYNGCKSQVILRVSQIRGESYVDRYKSL